jgi:hypothetical protein
VEATRGKPFRKSATSCDHGDVGQTGQLDSPSRHYLLLDRRKIGVCALFRPCLCPFVAIQDVNSNASIRAFNAFQINYGIQYGVGLVAMILFLLGLLLLAQTEHVRTSALRQEAAI